MKVPPQLKSEQTVIRNKELHKTKFLKNNKINDKRPAPSPFFFFFFFNEKRSIFVFLLFITWPFLSLKGQYR